MGGEPALLPSLNDVCALEIRALRSELQGGEQLMGTRAIRRSKLHVQHAPLYEPWRNRLRRSTCQQRLLPSVLDLSSPPACFHRSQLLRKSCFAQPTVQGL